MSDKIDVDALEKAFPWMDTSEFIADYVRDLFDTIRQLQAENEELQERAASFEGSFNAATKEIDELRAQVEQMDKTLDQVEDYADSICASGLLEFVQAARSK